MLKGKQSKILMEVCHYVILLAVSDDFLNGQKRNTNDREIKGIRENKVKIEKGANGQENLKKCVGQL